MVDHNQLTNYLNFKQSNFKYLNSKYQKIKLIDKRFYMIVPATRRNDIMDNQNGEIEERNNFI